jgi:cytochrome c-type biogenesis protein
MDLTIGIAFIGGLASFFTPCVLPLVPAYIGYLSGRSAAQIQAQDKGYRWTTIYHGLAFVMGFSVIFILLGITISALGVLLADIRPWIVRVGGIVIIIFGLHMMGVFRIPFLQYDLHPTSNFDRKRGFLSSFLMGVFFSAGWSPCVGPVLGLISEFVLETGSVIQGLIMLSFYSLGMAIPFLIAAFAIDWVVLFLRKYGKVLHYVEVVTGGVMVILGILLFFGIFQQIALLGTTQ